MWLKELVSNHDVLCKDGRPELAERTVEGKDYIGLYFSAHWCPPCRSFTPQLAQWYRKQSKAELIFISSDNDETAFKEYYGEMPWKAIPFDPQLNKALRDRFSVQGIPTLVILDAHSGELITDEARADINDDVDLTFSQWTPESVKEKQAKKQRAKEHMKNELPAIVQAELGKIMLVGPTDRTMLKKLLGNAAVQEFGQPLPEANLERVVSNMLEEFDENKTGIITPDGVARALHKRLANVSDPDAVAHYLKPQIVRSLAFVGLLELAQQEAKRDSEWAADGEIIQQCKSIFTKFDRDGDGRLLKEEFQAFLQATIQADLNGLYEHLDQGTGTGVEAKQLYTFVYKQVFVGRRKGDAESQISQDYSMLCTPRNKL